MAKMTSQIATIIRGSVGGDTYSANQFHPIILRARTAPVQPNTIWQTKIRSAFASAQVQWAGLTEEQRAAWIEYADSLTFTGPNGTYKVPGRQIFLSNYGWSLYLFDRAVPNQVVLPDAPEELGFASIQVLNVGPPIAEQIGYKVTGWNPNPEPMNVIVMNSRAFQPARYRYKGPFKSDIVFAATVNPDTGFEIAVYNLIDGQRYFCSVRGVTLDPAHRLTPLFYLNTIATEGE